jgi:uncharacterized protein YndB with AHSA1/START domain
MATRKLTHQIALSAAPERVFALLHTPSAIRGWWSAARAIVIPQTGGVWAAAWGDNEDNPDYIGIARLSVFDPPHRLVMADYVYHARSGPLPFSADFVTEFTIEPTPSGSILRVVQDGFPEDPSADNFYTACERGWRDTLEGIRRYLAR